jgi:uncharacterized membrane protein
MRNLLLIVHILAAGVWIGGSFYATFANSREAADAGAAKVLSEKQYFASRFFGTAVSVLVLSGVGLVILSDVFGWRTAFVLIGIAVVVVDGAFEGAILDPALKRGARQASGGPFGRNLRLGGAVHFALLVLAVWAMVVKPGL